MPRYQLTEVKNHGRGKHVTVWRAKLAPKRGTGGGTMRAIAREDREAAFRKQLYATA